MDHEHEYYNRPENKKPWWKTPLGITAIFFFVVAGYFLITEHGAHIGNNWIWLLLLACIGMHFFMHGGHSGHGGHNNSDDKEEK